ncbi:MAG: 4Fe-4S dicluster domain-containing protein [Peptostreptococcaceae bacterium]|nr:4Fe-4S dicluster domain-containing protein [Peptostreptococcaceae bacterium]
MKESYVDLINIRRHVFAEVARLGFSGADLSELQQSAYRILPGERSTYRESIFKERAILEERLRLTLGLNARKYTEYSPITDGLDELDLEQMHFIPPLVNVMPFACEACEERSFLVTNNCRRCLAHPCTNVCPKNAVSIGKEGAVIDQEKCIRCGRCKDTCPYSAIIEFSRPCSSVCGVKAIDSDYLGRAVIDQDKCVSCGRCLTQCPFGAIADKSQIYQLCRSLVSPKSKNMYAIIAPSFIDQFGPLASPQKIVEGIRKLGFQKVLEVSLGADITTIREAKEYLEKVPHQIPFMGTSCCSSWSMMVQKNFPNEFPQISDSASPMIETARHIKKNDPKANITFIGPCISKKLEALKDSVKGYVDFVITFEELMGMLVAKDIELSEIEISPEIEDDASALGRGYAVAGGVADAVKRLAQQIDPDREILVESAMTLKECMNMMKLAKAGRKNGYLLEGMACPGGCIGGPGTIASFNRVRKSLGKFMKESTFPTPLDNTHIKETVAQDVQELHEVAKELREKNQ